MSKSRNLADLLDGNGDVKASGLDNVPPSNDASALTTGTLSADRIAAGSIPAAKLANNAKTVKSATAPSSPEAGDTWFDTANRSMKFYDATDNLWKKISSELSVLDSVSGTILAGEATTLTLTGKGFLTSSCTVNFSQASDLIDEDVVVTATNDTTITVTVPSAVYSNVTAGNSVAVTVTNADQNTSSAVNLTATSKPTGGTITTYSGYRVHTFTSSGTFTIDSNYASSINCDVLIVAGGGSGGSMNQQGGDQGGGGAGGMLVGSGKAISAGSYTITVGAGGAQHGNNGGNSSGFGVTAYGGGYGNSGNGSGASGGSGGGGGGDGGNVNHPGGSATQNSPSGWTGYGNNGGIGANDGGGGGGAGAAGANSTAGNGGIGRVNNYRTGSNVYYAGGGGGGGETGGGRSGGAGGGGNGQASGGTANTGGGGGGTDNGYGYPGGSGIVVIRYAI